MTSCCLVWMHQTCWLREFSPGVMIKPCGPWHKTGYYIYTQAVQPGKASATMWSFVSSFSLWDHLLTDDNCWQTAVKAPVLSFSPPVPPGGRGRWMPARILTAGYWDSAWRTLMDSAWWLDESGGDIQLLTVGRYHPGPTGYTTLRKPTYILTSMQCPVYSACIEMIRCCSGCTIVAWG